MANISIIRVNGTDYDIKDAGAREQIQEVDTSVQEAIDDLEQEIQGIDTSVQEAIGDIEQDVEATGVHLSDLKNEMFDILSYDEMAKRAEYRVAGISNVNGSYTESTNQCSSNSYLSKDIVKITGINGATFRVIGYENGVFKGMYNGDRAINTSTRYNEEVDIELLRTLYPTYDYKITVLDPGGDTSTAYVETHIRYSISYIPEIERLDERTTEVETAAPIDFRNGGIGTNSGGYYTSETRISTKGYLSDSVLFVSLARNDWMFRVAAYENGAFKGMLNNSLEFVINSSVYHQSVSIEDLRAKFPTYKYKITGGNITDGIETLTPTDAVNFLYTVSKIESVRMQLQAQENANPADFQNSGIRQTDGQYTTSTTRIATKDYLPAYIDEVHVNRDDWMFRMAGYEDGVFMGMLNNNFEFVVNSTVTHKTVNLAEARKKYPTYQFKIAGGYTTDGTDITPLAAVNYGYIISKLARIDSHMSEIDQEMENLEDLIDDVSRGQMVLTGKTIAGLGDSIMYGSSVILPVGNGSFVEYVASVYSADAVNYSHGGACIGGTQHSYDIWRQVDTLIASGTTPDYILFNGMINDVYSSETDPDEDDKQDDEGRVPLGDIVSGYDPEDFDTSTFSGAFEYILYNLKTNFPNAKIIYMTTHNAGSRDYGQQVTYRQRALDICQKYSVRVADIYKYSNMNTNIQTDRDAFTRVTHAGQGADGTHPNRNGYVLKYFPIVAEQINNA